MKALKSWMLSVRSARRRGLLRVACAAVLATAGCASLVHRGPRPIHVGVTPNYPPLAFESDGRLMGAEIDFALALGRELGRPVCFIVLPWDEQIPALLKGRTDIIMSGMSITPERSRRIAFSDAYLGNNIYALVRRSDLRTYRTVDAVRKSSARLGVIENTTADAMVQKKCPSAERVVVDDSSSVPQLLEWHQIDAFIDDGWSLAYLLAGREADLALARGPLYQEELGWGLRPYDTALLAQVNEVLARWREDGTVIDVIRHWVPNIARLR